MLCFLLAGCALPLSLPDPASAISTDNLRDGAPLTGGVVVVPLPDDDVLGLNEDMRRFVAAHVDPNAAPARRLRQLIDAVMGGGAFQVRYNDRTYSAAEAFAKREANCLSFTAMFIALARHAGLTASFQEVDVPPDWARSGDSLLVNRHVNALIVRDGPDQAVDFNIGDFRSSYDRRAVPDARGLAHYYSNLGVDSMLAGDAIGALQHFRKALTEDAGFTAAWVNLGTLYQRGGHPDWAMAAWRHALDVDPQETVAMSNLERAYRELGNQELADRLLARIESYRLQNPYYRYYLARQAYDRNDYDSAIAHLGVAVRKKKSEDQFFALLGMSYLKRGDERAARRWIAQAEQVAADAGTKRM